MATKGLLKRTTLLKNLLKVIQNLDSTDLPAEIKAIYAFGGILREKSKLHDCDLVFLYSISEAQKARWNMFRENFSTVTTGDSKPRRYPLNELKPIFEPFKIKQIPLREACKDPNVAKTLTQKGISPIWAGCFSWTEITQGYHGDGIFYPNLDRVLRRLLIGKVIKGLQVQLQPYNDFMNGHTMLVAENYVLAWSRERPDAQKNIEDRLPEDKIDFITKELHHFLESELPRERNGGNLTRGYTDVKESVLKLTKEAGISINLDALDRQHTEINVTGKESYEELKQKCEIARRETRNYKNETKVLESVERALKGWLELKSDSYFGRYTGEQFVVEYVIENVEKQIIKEDYVRELLRILGLPEEHIITIKGYGFTYYKTAHTVREEQTFLKEAKLEGYRRKLIRSIMKVIRPMEKSVSVKLQLSDNCKPKSLVIEVYRQEIDQIQKEEVEKIKRDLEIRNFKLECRSWCITGRKWTDLTGEENVKQLQEIAKRMLAVD